MKRIFSTLLLFAQIAFANNEPILPLWHPDERKQMIHDGWIAGATILTNQILPPEQMEAETPLHIEPPRVDELATALEGEKDISEKYLAAYFEEKPKGHLVDPQELLSSSERKDIEALLDRHSGDSSIDMYVYVFRAAEQIPSDVREEELVERLYSAGKPALVVFYYLGESKRSKVYLSPVMADAVSAAEQRRALESSVMQSFGSAKSYDQLKAFLGEMSIRIYWMERMAAGAANKTTQDYPEGDASTNDHRKDKPVKKKFKIPEWGLKAASIFAVAFGGILVISGLVVWCRARAKHRFPLFEVEPRLGGSHAAGIGAVISFASAAIPPAMQRNQVPDYTRRA